MGYVVRLESTLKRPLSLELAPLTYVVGTNESGKTALTQALELALTGQSDTLPMVGVELLEMVPQGQALTCRAVLSDGREGNFSVTGTTARAKKPVWLAGGGAPLATILNRQVADLLRGRPDRMRRALLEMVGGDTTAEALAQAVPSAFADEWRRLWTGIAATLGGASPVEVLLAVAAEIDKQLRIAKAAIKDGAVAEQAAAAAGGVDLPAAEARLAAAQRAMQRALEQAVEEARAAADARAAQAAGLPDPATLDVMARYWEASALAGSVTAERCPTACRTCGAGQGAWWLEGAQRARAEGHAAVLAAQKRLREIAAPTSAAEIDPAITTELRAAQALVQQARAARVDQERRDAAAQAAQAAEERTITLGGLSKVCARLIKERLQAGTQRFAATAARALGAEGEGVFLELADGAREVCRVGLTRSDGSRISYRALSGAAQMRLALALAAARGESVTDRVRLAIVDEIALGESAWHALTEGAVQALSDGLLDQVIVTTVQPPPALLPGWNMAQL